MTTPTEKIKPPAPPANKYPFKINPEKARRLWALGRCTWENREKLKDLFKNQKVLDEFQTEKKKK